MAERNYWQRMRRQRLSRRALLRASGRAGVGAAGLALVGCGDDDDDAPSSSVAQAQQQAQAQQAAPAQQQQAQTDQQAERADQQAAAEGEQPQSQQPAASSQQPAASSQIVRQYGGNFSRDMPWNFDFFDPHRSNFALPFFLFNDAMGRLIQMYDNTGPVYGPDLMSLPEIPDDETYIFKADRGARFWDRFPTEGGRLFTAEDAAVNIRRQIDAVDANGEPDSLFWRAALYQETAAVDVTDEQTLVLKTDGPNSTYLETTHMGFSFMTSPEAIELWDLRWRDEQANVELVSGCGPFIPTVFEPEGRVHLERRPDEHWDVLDGQTMPFLDSITWLILQDPTAVETAYRTGAIDHVDSLPAPTVDGIEADFPDHVRFNRPVVLPFANRYNFNTQWDENPWLDRRVPYAFHIAMDRDAIIGQTFLGNGKVSAIQHINWYHAWAIPEEELRSLAGYRPVKDEDNAEARKLLDAAGVEPGTVYDMIVADIFEGRYPGTSELYTNMYRDALDVKIRIELEPYDSIFQQLTEGKFPGHLPIWVGAGTGDPTGAWNNRLVFGASGNNEHYNFPPVEEIVKEMRVTLDNEKRREMATEVSWILLGEDDRYGLDGFAAFSVACNGIDTSIHWPYLTMPDRAKNVWEREGWHWRKEFWIDHSHPEVPERSRPA